MSSRNNIDTGFFGNIKYFQILDAGADNQPLSFCYSNMLKVLISSRFHSEPATRLFLMIIPNCQFQCIAAQDGLPFISHFFQDPSLEQVKMWSLVEKTTWLTVFWKLTRFTIERFTWCPSSLNSIARSRFWYVPPFLVFTISNSFNIINKSTSARTASITFTVFEKVAITTKRTSGDRIAL